MKRANYANGETRQNNEHKYVSDILVITFKMANGECKGCQQFCLTLQLEIDVKEK